MIYITTQKCLNSNNYDAIISITQVEAHKKGTESRQVCDNVPLKATEGRTIIPRKSCLIHAIRVTNSDEATFLPPPRA
jgi:hypothetical protein